jgi:hypothetical protein
MQSHTYNAVERALHHLALGSRLIAEMSFDINLLLSPGHGAAGGGSHVFVSGLARAGTTIIMRRLHETGLFRSLTYRDMPFVLCPNMWERLWHRSRRNIEAVERAHGDRLMVDVDSPEALDEVFWRIFAGDDYIKEDHLQPHRVDGEVIDKFRQYISCVLQCEANGQPKRRYLSKNNNNLLRLRALRDAFPDSIILVPFRDPIQQAGSLLNQHRKFSQLQGEDAFLRSYMKWLAHHEFGLEHRPLWFDSGKTFKPSPHQPDDINYWLESWVRTYGWVYDSRPDNALLVCYEDICSEPAAWQLVLERLGIAETADVGQSAFSRAGTKAVTGVDVGLGAAATALYRKLREDSARRLAAPPARRTAN